MKSQFTTTIQQFAKRNILVIGESMLDTYLKGTSSRICREAPVPIVDVTTQEHIPGGAANTAVNVAALGGKVIFLSVLGSDQEGKILVKRLKDFGVMTNVVLVDKTRKTLAKKRIVANGQIVVRFDSGNTETIQKVYEDELINRLIDLYPKIDAVIISDYGYGILTPAIREVFQKLQRQMPRILVVDSKYLDLYKEIHPSLVKPNFQETVALLGITKPATKGNRAEQIVTYREQLLEKTGAYHIAVTMDNEGAIIINKKFSYRTYADPIHDSQAVGAGDTYTSAFTLSLAAGTDITSAAEIASHATAVVVKKDGTAHCTNEELHQTFIATTKIIVQRKQLHELVRKYKQERRRIVFTNGCFDILHSGHVKYLNQAKSFGDILIIGINSDESIKRLKGANRPVNSLVDRMHVLSALSSVDHVVSFEEDTPVKLIKLVKPDVHVKGGDYTADNLPETPIVRKMGGRVEIVPLLSGKSTTRTIEKIVTNYADNI